MGDTNGVIPPSGGGRVPAVLPKLWGGKVGGAAARVRILGYRCGTAPATRAFEVAAFMAPAPPRFGHNRQGDARPKSKLPAVFYPEGRFQFWRAKLARVWGVVALCNKSLEDLCVPEFVAILEGVPHFSGGVFAELH